MRVIAFSIEGYRRFLERSSVKLHGKLIAFVGPNEAGKSSLLKALARLNSTADFEQGEYPRRNDRLPRLSWVLQLEDDDKAQLVGIHDASNVEALELTRYGNGSVEYELRPNRPRRPRSFRTSALASLAQHRASSVLADAHADPEQTFDLGAYDHVVELLNGDTEDFSAEQAAAILDLASKIRVIRTDDPDEEAQETESPLVEETFTDELATLIKSLGEEEGADPPHAQCWRVLKPRLPTVRIFGIEDRNLQSSYDLTTDADNPPTALANLAKLASLDLAALRDEAVASRLADLATRRDAANERLRAVFSESWNQEDVAVQIEVQATVLHILATTPADGGLSTIDERSDGMRWFAALIAFCHALADRPVILVDEIETHLHYDAQTDLIDVLAAQDFASKVIYTTHSFGCLPHDLGTGVRIVEQIDAGTSRLENGFWHRGAGFQPLLASMGAAAMSFTPTRRAVIAEGPADAILLPTLLRQVLEVARLNFQVAPGLSIVAAAKMSDLDSEAGSVVYLVDGDQGGRDLIKNLRAAGVEDSRIVILQHGAEELELEDLIDPEIYASAVNEEMKIWNAEAIQLAVGDLSPNLRSKGLAEWCATKGLQAPDKRAVAQRVVDESGEMAIFAPAREEFLREIGNRLFSLFGD